MISERRIALPGECTSDLAVRAALKAIENSDLKKEDIDLIIVATATPDLLVPSTAAIVQDKIQAYNTIALDISAVLVSISKGKGARGLGHIGMKN